MSSSKIKLPLIFDSIFYFVLPLQNIEAWDKHVFMFKVDELDSLYMWRCHFTHTWRTLAWPHHFKRGLSPKFFFNPATFYWSERTNPRVNCHMYVCLRVSSLHFSKIFHLDFGIVITLWYFLFFILSRCFGHIY